MDVENMVQNSLTMNYMIEIWKKGYLASPALHGIYIGALSNTGVT